MLQAAKGLTTKIDHHFSYIYIYIYIYQIIKSIKKYNETRYIVMSHMSIEQYVINNKFNNLINNKYLYIALISKRIFTSVWSRKKKLH